MRPWWLRILAFAKPYWPSLAAVGGLMLAASAAQVLKPWPMKVLVDDVFPRRPLPDEIEWLQILPGGDSAVGLCAWLAGSTLVIFAATWTIQTLQAYIQSGVAARISYALGANLFEHLQRLSLRFHSRQPAGDLVRRVTRDSRCAQNLVSNVAMPALTSVSVVIMMFVIMWQMDWALSVASLAVLFPLVVANRLFYGTMMTKTYEQQEMEGAMMSQAERVLTALPVVQSFRRERYEDGRFREATEKTLKAYFRALAAQLKFRLTVSTATTIGRAAIMILGGYRVLQGELTIGGLLVFLAYLGSLYEPLETLTHMTASVASAEASARRVLDVLDDQDHVPLAAIAPEPPKGRWHGMVRFERVNFAYEPGRLVLCEVDFAAKPGEVVAIVGHTGAGKSTLMSLLLRLFDPCSGRITLDGVDLRDIFLSEVRAQIGILLQEPFLLPVSIAENIAYGRPDASREEILAAAAAARADEFIRRLPDGYDTTVGERGMTLSGGQKQRIAIARALLKNAPVIILDEPTSALDARTEWQVINEVRPLLAERTVFVIAHRLSTIRHADRVVVMQAGRIVQEGHHSELVAKEGVYREMYREHSVQFRRVATS